MARAETLLERAACALCARPAGVFAAASLATCLATTPWVSWLMKRAARAEGWRDGRVDVFADGGGVGEPKITDVGLGSSHPSLSSATLAPPAPPPCAATLAPPAPPPCGGVSPRPRALAPVTPRGRCPEHDKEGEPVVDNVGEVCGRSGSGRASPPTTRVSQPYIDIAQCGDGGATARGVASGAAPPPARVMARAGRAEEGMSAAPATASTHSKRGRHRVSGGHTTCHHKGHV